MENRKSDPNRSSGSHSTREKNNYSAIFSRLKPSTLGRVFTISVPSWPNKHIELDQAKLLINCAYYSDLYKGKLIIRIDDSGDPDQSSAHYEASILQDLQLLGIKSDVISHTSDFFIRCEEWAEKLIKLDLAYMDIAPEYESQFRNRYLGCMPRSSAESLQLFKLLCLGHLEGEKYVLKARYGINFFPHEQVFHFRKQDPIIYRHGNSIPHYRMGNDFSAYPSPEFARPIADAFEGVTHIIVTSEEEENFYSWVQRSLQFKPVIISTFGKVEMVENPVNIQSQGFDSPGTIGSSFSMEFSNQMPTLKELMRRGMSMVPLRAHLLSLGASKKKTLVKWESLWGANRKFLEPLAPRFMAVRKKGHIRMTVARVPQGSSSLVVPMHPRNEALGTRTLQIGDTVLLDGQDAESIEEGEEVTLLRWTSVLVTCIHRDLVQGKALSLESEFLPVFKFLKKKKAVTWLADCPELVPLKLVQFGVKSVAKSPPFSGRNYSSNVSHSNTSPYISKTACTVCVEALGDPSLSLLKENDLIQLERLGFFRVDVPFVNIHEPMVLFMIPDGKNKSKSSMNSLMCHANESP